MTDLICPHCEKGKLAKYSISDSRDYTCVGGCGRGWIIGPKGNYHAVFSAGNEVYSPFGHLLNIPHISLTKKGGSKE